MTVPLTLLIITPISGSSALELPPYSARGLTQTLELIPGSGVFDRSINGVAMDFSMPQLRKYQSTITCKDGDAPAFDGAWAGLLVEVQCAIELRYLTGATPQRPAVLDSTYVNGAFTYYRPLLMMMLQSFRNSFAEYEARYAWMLELQEI